jgi:predicted nucleotidyltransferase
MTSTPRPGNSHIPASNEKLAEFCRRWKVAELALFGSALRSDFTPASDVDLLVTFEPEADWSLLDHVAMEEELSAIVGRKVDLVSRRAIERSAKWIRRKAILGTAEPLYVAR